MREPGEQRPGAFRTDAGNPRNRHHMARALD